MNYMENDYDIIIDGYIKEYYYVDYSEIKLTGDRVSTQSFNVKSNLTEDSYTISELSEEINLIFGDYENKKDVPVILLTEWFDMKIAEMMDEMNPKLMYIKNYFPENIILKLGPRNWQAHYKNGKPFILKSAIDDLDEIGLSWVNTQIVRHFYDKWYEDEVINASERYMGIS